jgi:hypothetical protein
MQLERIAPEGFIAKSVESKDLPAVREQLVSIRVDLIVKGCRRCRSRRQVRPGSGSAKAKYD